MEICNILEEKEIKWSVLKENLALVDSIDYQDSADLNACPSCDSRSTRQLASEDWTSSAYCSSCNSILFTVRADRMSGNFSETIYVYRDIDDK